MDQNLFAQRRSVRQFKADPVPPDLARQLIEAAVEAPSGGNCQPWHFYQVDNPILKEKLGACAYSQSFISTAPLLFVVCAEPQRSAERYAERGRDLYSVQDTAAAVENILLCAAGLGLGGCWCGAFDEAAVSQALNLPASQRPVALLPLGYPLGEGKKPKRRPLDEVFTVLE